MPISEPEWLSVASMVEKIVKRIIGTRADFFVTGKVSKVDKANKCIFMKEFGDQPIPIVGFDSEVKYYDTDNTGKIIAKKATVTVVMPKVGATVLVAREMGLRRMPRCLGVVQGKNWMTPEAE
jgi:hypothetical protein